MRSIMISRGKAIVALASSLAVLSMASGYSHMVNYRGQPQEDLTCMQASTIVGSETVVYRNDPSTNCFGFPSLQFDTAPIEGGKPNGMTIDWSLMVDQLQMQDDDRIQFHLPGFTGAHNSFGIMGPAIDTAVDSNQYTPNFESEAVAGDSTASDALRADFGALVGIWGISCGTEKNLYMDRAKVDNLRTAEWDPAREMLKFVLKARRWGPPTGRHDAYTGTRSAEFANLDSITVDLSATANWVYTAAADQGKAIPFSRTNTDPRHDTSVDNAAPTAVGDITINDQSLRGSHLQAMEYAFEGPRESLLATDPSIMGTTAITAAITNYKNDGYIYAPGNRVCGIYVDPTKLFIGQKASNMQNGMGPLPPFGGIGKNWYKLAFMRRFANTQCSGGQTRADGKASRPGMLPETCSTLIVSQDLSLFWQVPFDGDTERVVGYQFTTTQQMLPIAGKSSSPAGYLQEPTFSFAQAKGKKTGKGLENCITVSLIPSVTFVSGSTKITIEGLLTSETTDTDTLQLYSDSDCKSVFSTLKGADGVATKTFQPVSGTAAHGTPDSGTSALLHSYRPFGRAAILASDGKTRARTLMSQIPDAVKATANEMGSGGYFDDVDWHTRARSGTATALTTGNPNNNVATASTLAAATGLSSMLTSTEGTLATGNGKAKFVQATGKLSMKLAHGYHIKTGQLLVFSFMLKNSNNVQPEQSLAVIASGTYCDSGDDFCDGVNDKSLDIKSFPIVSQGKLLKSEVAKFLTSTIYQSSADPDDLTTIFVTLKTSLDLKRQDATADAKVTISGLDKCGFATGTNLKLYQNQKSGGIAVDNKYPTEAIISTADLPGLASTSTLIDTILGSSAVFEGGALKINLGTTGLIAETEYAFAFQMMTSSNANAGCQPQISSLGGSEVIAAQDMSAKKLGVVMAPQFTKMKIGQVTTRPGVTNYLCVTLQHNFQFYSDAVVNQGVGATGNYIESKITISGLTGTQAVSTGGASTKGYALAYCPTSVPYFDDRTTQHTSTQFQPDVTDFTPKRYATFQSTCFGDSLANQKCIPGNPYVPSSALDTSVAGRSWFGGQSLDKDSFTWDQATGTAVLTVDADITKERISEPQTVKGGIPKNAEIVFALPLQNGVAESGCKTVTFEASGKIVQKATMVQTKTGRALQDGEMPGDACALKVYAPGFLVRQITQSTSTTSDDNVITISLRTNVDFTSVANGQASYITIAGITGTATANSDKLQINAPSMKFSPKFEAGTGKWIQSSGLLTLKIDAGSCLVPTVWSSGKYYDGTSTKDAPYALGGSDVSGSIQTSTLKTTLVDSDLSYGTGGKVGTTMPSVCIKAGFVYSFSFSVVNPDAEQAAPLVSIKGTYRDSNNAAVEIVAKAMTGPISDDSDKAAMYVSNQILTTYKIGQLVPAPGSINVICVTIKASKDIKSQPNAPLSSITITGLTGFDASAQDLQLYEPDGVTKITTTGGNPATTGSASKVGAIFSSQNSASGSQSTTSGLGFGNYDGGAKGNVIFWIAGETATTGGVYSYVQKNVEHKFCFQLKNPKLEMSCKDASFVVNNKGAVATIKAEQDISNAIEDYQYGSTCAGYIAPPNFVVKTWRSSSNTTDTTAFIRLELASNIELEAGDTITVSGLSSYTLSCPSPPCDVALDVSRTQVSYVYGKPYVNGVRNVKGIGSSDSGASAAERITFAKAIQSIDQSGKTDDGVSLTSTFGKNAAWGKLGDTESSSSTLTFTVAKDAKMLPRSISTLISTYSAPSDATMYNIGFTLKNKVSAVSSAPIISIRIGKGQTQYVSLPVTSGQKASTVSNGIKVCNGGLDISYTPMKTIYGGESLVLTLPRFSRDSNGMLFGITSSPNSAFKTYSNSLDWKTYGTDQKYARAFFTNGWNADGYSAKSGDSGQTGERWNYPNVNAKVTTDADYNHDTGVLVLDINDPGIGQNKDYWYAAIEDNLYEGRVTRAANDGSAAAYGFPATAADLTSTSLPQAMPGNAATADYYLDNGEDLYPARAFAFMKEEKDAGVTYNNFRRPVAFLKLSTTTPTTSFVSDFNTVNTFPAPLPTTATALANDIDGTPPFKGIPTKFQPSRRDNFYKGMLMKCWVGTASTGGRHQYVASKVTGTDNYLAEATPIQELLPPPEYRPISAYGKKLSSAIADSRSLALGVVQSTMTASTVTDAKAFAKAGVSRTLETRVIQASFRQIDYVPRKSGGCFYTGDVAYKTTVNGAMPAAAGTLFTAATATTARIIARRATIVTGAGVAVGDNVVFSDLKGRTITATTADTDMTVDGPPVQEAGGFASTTPVFKLTAATTLAAVGCQDEVPGYPAVVRLESPFSRTLDPDTLCYIQRKADVGVYTGMTAMVGNNEYTIKQGAANIYTVGFVSKNMKGTNGDPVDRKVPRSYSTEAMTMPTDGKRTSTFFGDGVGLSGQPYTIYSQLELVAKRGSKVMLGETITITIPSSSGISVPPDLSAFVTPATTGVLDTIAEKIKISHVLLVPLSPACSIVAAYGVNSGCQEGNGKGGVFDLILSDKWPYAYTSENLNDINGYSMTVFGGQATVVKTMADKYSQDLPYKPLEGRSEAVFAADAVVVSPSFRASSVLNPMADTLTEPGVYAREGQGIVVHTATAVTLGRAQSGTTSFKTLQSTVAITDLLVSGSSNPNSLIDATFTVSRELDTLSLTMGSLRADSQKTPKLPNAPITVTDGACGTKVSDTLGPATLPYAVCMSLGGSMAHNQDLGPVDLVANAYTAGTAADGVLLGTTTTPAFMWGVPVQVTGTVVPQASLRAGMVVAFDSTTTASRVFAVVNSIDDTATFTFTCTRVFPPNNGVAITVVTGRPIVIVNVGPQADETGKLLEGVQKITGAVGQEATPVMPTMAKDLYSKMGSARTMANYGSAMGYTENPADNLGLGAFIVVGVYNNGTSDRFVTAQEGNKGSAKLALPTATDMANNLVLQRYLGTSRTTIPLAEIPSGFIGASLLKNQGAAFKAPAGQVPRYQVRVAGGYALGRFSHGVDNIMHVRSDVTSGAQATGYEGAATSITGTVTTSVGYLAGRTNVMPVSDVGFANMDGAIPASPHSGSSLSLNIVGSGDYTTDLLLTTMVTTAAVDQLPQAVVTRFVVLTVGTALASKTLKVGDYIMTGATAAGCAASGEVMRVMSIISDTSIMVERSIRGLEVAAGPRNAAGAITHLVCIIKNGQMNKHLSGHSVDVAMPTLMQKVRFGRGTLPMPQVFHTASHQASATGYANSLTRGHCGREGSGAGLATTAVGFTENINAEGLNTAPATMTDAFTAASTREMCTQFDNNAVVTDSNFNTGMPFSRNTFIEKGMDVYLVSSLFDSLIQRPEPIRLTAIGTTEEGRLQQVAGSGFYAGDAQTGNVIETGVTITPAIALSASVGGLTSIAVAGTTAQLAIGDLIFVGTSLDNAIASTAEIMKINGITSATGITVERGVLGTPIVAIANNAVIFKISDVSGAFPGTHSFPTTGPQVSKRNVQGVHTAHNQVYDNIQTNGLRMARGGPGTGPIVAATHANAKGSRLASYLTMENHAYGFDSDFRLYSVLGPFMRPAVIRDVIDTSKISRSVQTSRFPGVLTIHQNDSAEAHFRKYFKVGSLIDTRLVVAGAQTLTATVIPMTVTGTATVTVLSVGDYLMMSLTKVAAVDTAANGEIMQVVSIDSTTQITVMRGILGTRQVAITDVSVIWKIDIPPMEDRNNNGLYSLAPIKGTSFATAQTRTTQYHTYHTTEADRIISFCNPMQSDLNNAPGSVIMSAIADDPVSKYSIVPAATDLSAAVATAITGGVLTAATTTLTVNIDPQTLIFPGDYIMIGTATAAAAITRGEIILVTALTATTLTVTRGALGTTAAAVLTADSIFRLKFTAATPGVTVHGVTGTNKVVNSYMTRSSPADTKYASSNGKEETAPSMWTVPRRHHLCRKLITGAPELSLVDAAKDLYVIANIGAASVYSEVYARSRYTESIQANTVLNQDPSPNMRAMVTFVEPTMIPVLTTSCGPVCQSTSSEFNAAKVDPNCPAFTVTGPTSSITLPGGTLPSWFTITLQEIEYASYPTFDKVNVRRATAAESIVTGIATSDRSLGFNNYNKGMCLGNFLRVNVPARNTDPNEKNAVTFTIKQKVIRDGDLAGIDTKQNSQRRRLLAVCPAGFEARMVVIGSSLKSACDCENICVGTNPKEGTCTTKKGGDWNIVNLVERTCKPVVTPYDATGAIVGGVLGGFFGLLLLLCCLWFILCRRRPTEEPVGRAVAVTEKPLAPVYLPQNYQQTPEQYVPFPLDQGAPMPMQAQSHQGLVPMPVFAGSPEYAGVQMTGQPMIYSSYQGPQVVEQAFPNVAPFGVAPQPYGTPMPYGVMAPQDAAYMSQVAGVVPQPGGSPHFQPAYMGAPYGI